VGRLRAVRVNGFIIGTYREVREFADNNRWIVEIAEPSCSCVPRALMAVRAGVQVRLKSPGKEGEVHGGHTATDG
jgi:hypothetical protein